MTHLKLKLKLKLVEVKVTFTAQIDCKVIFGNFILM